MKRSELLARLALILFGLLIGAVGLEGVLRIASYVATPGGPTEPQASSKEQPVILCLGDSNTYGLWLQDRESEAYPGRLAALWNSEGRPTVEVVNLGYPGNNSSRVIHHLSAWLELTRPAHVLLMIGVNDYWTIPIDSEGSSSLRFLERHSRLYKTLYLMFQRARVAADRNVDTTEVEGRVFDMRWRRAERPDPARGERLEANLTEIVERVRRFGSRVHLMTYPSNYVLYARANKKIRAVAAATGTPLIDHQSTFAPLCTKPMCPEWLFDDQHPRPKSHEIIATGILVALAGEARLATERR